LTEVHDVEEGLDGLGDEAKGLLRVDGGGKGSAGENGVKLGEPVRSDVAMNPSSMHPGKGREGSRMVGMFGLERGNEDVRVEVNLHDCHIFRTRSSRSSSTSVGQAMSGDGWP